jgi:hypothetical protein
MNELLKTDGYTGIIFFFFSGISNHRLFEKDSSCVINAAIWKGHFHHRRADIVASKKGTHKS